MAELRAFRIRRDDAGFDARLTDMQLHEQTAGDVVIDVRFSSVNYKDALAGSGKGRILRRPELNGGIDLAGVVSESASADFAVGDEVFVCGAGLSETLDGGYATRARLPASVLRRPPPGLSLRDTMAIGTAGITAAIALQRLEENGQPKDNGPILVTGATGGVGSFATHLLTLAGYEVTASSGKPEAEAYLRSLGAGDVVGRLGGDTPPKALESAVWGGAVDSIGGETLSRLASTTRPWGSIACIGLAGGSDFSASVMPLILRGVSLVGINCIELPDAMLDRCWERLGSDWKPQLLDTIAPHQCDLDGLPAIFDAMMQGAVTGRTVVNVT